MYEGFSADIPPSRLIYYLIAKEALLVGLCEEKTKKQLLIFLLTQKREQEITRLCKRIKELFLIFL